MSYQQAATRIKAESQDGSSQVILPVDNLEVRPVPYVPEGSTQLKLYDDRRKFRSPTYGIKLMLSYSFERTDYRPSVFGTMQDLLEMYHSGKTVDFLVKYDKDTDTFVNDSTTGIADYRCPNMIPDIAEETVSIIFEEQARQKPRELELMSSEVSYTYSQIKWIAD